MPDADIVALAMPLARFPEVDPGLLSGKLVVDAMNYWPASDGVLEAFEAGASSEIVARRPRGAWLDLHLRARHLRRQERRRRWQTAVTNIELYGHQVIPRVREPLS